MSDDIYMVPNPPLPNRAIQYDPDVCTGCDLCIEVCKNDVLMPNPDKRQPPIVLYPEECWYCGACVEECPIPGSIEMVHPLKQMVSMRWRDAENGDEYRLGMKNPPPPNNTPPSGVKYRAKVDGVLFKQRGVKKR